MQQQKGFTLIELVMVIVILGILAAFALPRFADLGNNARASVIEGAAGSVKSAASIVHSKWLAMGGAGITSVPLDGLTTNVPVSTNGYPQADSTGIGEAAQLDNNFKITSASGTATVNLLNGSSTVPNCSFQYSDSTGTISSLNKTCQ